MNLPVLEEPCSNCGGKGQIEGKRTGHMVQLGGPCETCRGVGWMPTDAGRQIIQLMLHERRKGNWS